MNECKEATGRGSGKQEVWSQSAYQSFMGVIEAPLVPGQLSHSVCTWAAVIRWVRRWMHSAGACARATLRAWRGVPCRRWQPAGGAARSPAGAGRCAGKPVGRWLGAWWWWQKGQLGRAGWRCERRRRRAARALELERGRARATRVVRVPAPATAPAGKERGERWERVSGAVG